MTAIIVLSSNCLGYNAGIESLQGVCVWWWIQGNWECDKSSN